MNAFASSCGICSRSARPNARQAVDDPVVDHLGLAAHADVQLLRREVEDGAGGLGVDVLAAQEDVAQDLLVGDVGQDAELDLVVVDAQQDVPGLGDEAGADLAAGLGADRDVLQVRVDARQAPGGGRRLLERGVQPAVGADPVRERVQVGLGELGQLAVALDLGDDRVLVADRLQHLGVGAEAGLAAALAAELELLEQDLRRAAAASRSRTPRPRAPRSRARAGRRRRGCAWRRSRAACVSSLMPCFSVSRRTCTSGSSTWFIRSVRPRSSICGRWRLASSWIRTA